MPESWLPLLGLVNRTKHNWLSHSFANQSKPFKLTAILFLIFLHFCFIFQHLYLDFVKVLEMGNKSGKFSVPNTAVVNKDEAVINENAVKVEETHNGDVHLEDIKTDEKATTETDNAVPPKGKRAMSWLKKFSIKKEKKPNAPKQNGVKEEVAVAPKENGDVEEVAPTEAVKIEETVAIAKVDDVQCEQTNEVSTKEDEAHSEKPAVDCHVNGIESSESHAEEQKVDCVD